MRKITFVLGAGVGFVLGSKAGPGAYQQLEAKARKVAGRPEVQDAVEQLKSTAADKLPSSDSDTEPVVPEPATVPETAGYFETGAPITSETPVLP